MPLVTDGGVVKITVLVVPPEGPLPPPLPTIVTVCVAKIVPLQGLLLMFTVADLPFADSLALKVMAVNLPLQVAVNVCPCIVSLKIEAPFVEVWEILQLVPSLSVMTIFCEVVPKAMPDEGLLMVSVAVSVPSTSASSTTVKVTEPVVCPLGMVIVVLLKV